MSHVTFNRSQVSNLVYDLDMDGVFRCWISHTLCRFSIILLLIYLFWFFGDHFYSVAKAGFTVTAILTQHPQIELLHVCNTVADSTLISF